MAGETTVATGGSILSSVLSTLTSALGFGDQLFSGASQDVSADTAAKGATSNAETEANKKRMAIETKDQTEAMLAEARIEASRAASPNDPYYGRPVV